MAGSADADHVALDAFIEREGDALARAMKQRGDLIPEFLRFHLLTECQLERLIQALLPRGDRLLDHGGLGYRQKLDLVDALDVLPDRVVRALHNLDDLRGRYARQVDPAISSTDVGTIGRSLGTPFSRSRVEAAENLDRLVNGTFGLLYGYLIRAVHRAEYPPVSLTPSELDQLADVAAREKH